MNRFNIRHVIFPTSGHQGGAQMSLSFVGALSKYAIHHTPNIATKLSLHLRQ